MCSSPTGRTPSPTPLILGLLLLGAALACQEEDEDPDFYLPAGHGGPGGRGPVTSGTGNNSPDSDAGTSDAQDDAQDDPQDDPQDPPALARVAPGAALFLRQDPQGSQILYDDGSLQTLGTLQDDQGDPVILPPNRLSLTADGEKLLYSVGATLYTSRLDGSQAAVLLDASSLPGTSALHQPRPTPTGGSIFFLAGQDSPQGVTNGRLYRLAAGSTQPTLVQPPLDSCEGFSALAPLNTNDVLVLRGPCAAPQDQGLFLVRVPTSDIAPLATLTLTDPEARPLALAIDPRQGDIYLAAQGGFDLDGDGLPEPAQEGVTICRWTEASPDPTCHPLPLFPGRFVRGLERAGDLLLLDVSESNGQGAGIFAFSFDSDELAVVNASPNLSNPQGR